MGSILMDMHEKWMAGKGSFTMEHHETDNEEFKKPVRPDSNEPQHTGPFLAWPGPYGKEKLYQHRELDLGRENMIL